MRSERIFKVSAEPLKELAPGVSVVGFASAANGAEGFSTGMAVFRGGAGLPFHTHPCGESITILGGCAAVAVEHRVYHLDLFDSIYVPAGVPHALRNLDTHHPFRAHTAFASADVTRHPVSGEFNLNRQPLSVSPSGSPESLLRFRTATQYELSPNAFFKDLFARRLGSKGICGGYGRFGPGASLPCHTHKYDESISIIEGVATCLVAGRCYTLSGCDTAVVPHGLCHRFINESSHFMAMIWVYAGDEPERAIVDNSLCSGKTPV
jgi:quercetin dioxygenase-like cupin family protein